MPGRPMSIAAGTMLRGAGPCRASRLLYSGSPGRVCCAHYARARPVPFTFSSITRGRRAASVVCFASAASTRAGARSSMKHPGRSLRGSKRCCVSQGERRLRCVRPITPSPRFSADGRRSFAFRRRNVRSATAGCAHTAIRASRCSCSGALPPRCRCSNPSARLQCCRAAPTARPSRGLGGPPEAERAEQISVDAVFAAWCGLVATQATAEADFERPPAPLSTQTRSVRMEPSALSSSVR